MLLKRLYLLMANRKRLELIEIDEESEQGESTDSDYMLTSDITEAAKRKCVSGVLNRLSPMKN